MFALMMIVSQNSNTISYHNKSETVALLTVWLNILEK